MTLDNLNFFPVIIALVGVLSMMFFWVGVQRAWQASFPEHNKDGDALACRGGCGSCKGECQSHEGKGADV